MNSTLSSTYISIANFLFPEKPKDLRIMGVNEQGFPIVGSESSCCSFELIIIDFSK